jgi:hypothetical protein
LCGAVRFVGKGAVKGVEVCHCADCRRWTGGPFFSLRFAESMELADPTKVRWFESSEWAERGSCAKCGSALFWKMKDTADPAVAAGAIDDQSALPPIEEHIFIDGKPPYVDYADDAARLTGAETIARHRQQ